MYECVRNLQGFGVKGSEFGGLQATGYGLRVRAEDSFCPGKNLLGLGGMVRVHHNYFAKM